ncbi:hypothetical protein V8C43DRAFT_289983 [Trichoderma afarasin]
MMPRWFRSFIAPCVSLSSNRSLFSLLVFPLYVHLQVISILRFLILANWIAFQRTGRIFPICSFFFLSKTH